MGSSADPDPRAVVARRARVLAVLRIADRARRVSLARPLATRVRSACAVHGQQLVPPRRGDRRARLGQERGLDDPLPPGTGRELAREPPRARERCAPGSGVVAGRSRLDDDRATRALRTGDARAHGALARALEQLLARERSSILPPFSTKVDDPP